MTEAKSIAEIMEQMGICMSDTDPLDSLEKVIWTAYPCWLAWKTRIEANKIRRQTRANHSCIKCGYSKNVILHHILPVAAGGDNSEENLAWLCKMCHRAVHAHKAYGSELFEVFIREKGGVADD